jgi:hypothetical protein
MAKSDRLLVTAAACFLAVITSVEMLVKNMTELTTAVEAALPGDTI